MMKQMIVMVFCGLLLNACGNTPPASSQAATGTAQAAQPGNPGPGAPTGAPAPGASAADPAKASKGRVASVMVLEKQEACACTKDRQNKSWEALQAALSSAGYTPSVQKLYTDTQPEESALYTSMKPMMVPPAYYFFDAQQNLLEMLQGELAAEAFTKVLSGE